MINGIKLTANQRENLIKQGCRSDNWDNILVSENFSEKNIYNCRFSQKIYLGANVFISNVGSVIENCVISDSVHIENVGAIRCFDGSCFGIGVEVCAVNENGGRSVPLFRGLTAQTAYILAMYRHRTDLVAKIQDMISAQQAQSASSMCVIGQGARLFGCGALEGVCVGQGAVIEGVTLLKNGTVESSAEEPTYLGYGVIMQDFITERGAKVDNASQLKRCFVGQNAHIDSGFSAVDSLFFANSDLANGECCSVFAGPYTVSHHKSSLLIAGLFSFFNAGSGSNQSNHLFKTGPVHQAIHERGCKYASNAYIMAPARTGAFNVIIGRHTSHHNTENFPFSYLLDNEGKSFLMPAASLRSCGTMRDIAKWPNRDGRKSEKMDLVHFDMWNPYLGNKIKEAIRISEELLSNQEVQVYTYERVKIKKAMLKMGLGTYKSAWSALLGHILSAKPICEPNALGAGQWVDIAGMYAPKSAIDGLLDDISSSRLSSFDQVNERLKDIFNNYETYAYQWARSFVDENSIDQIIEQGQQDAMHLAQIAQSDSKGDSSALMQVGYGIDELDVQLKELDFCAVRNL